MSKQGATARREHAPEPVTAHHGLSATTGEIAALVGGDLVGPADLRLIGFGAISDAQEGSLTFIRSASFAKMWAGSAASAALVARGIDVADHDPRTRALIVVDDPDLAMITLVEHAQAITRSTRQRGVHETAVIDSSTHVDPSAWIGPHCVVSAGARIGANSILVSGVHIGEGVSIGSGVTLMPSVFVGERCEIGDASMLHANVSIGADGFGYRPHPTGEGYLKVPHLGAVRIGSDVEIGAGSCVDRGTLGDTLIGDGTKIDNLVQIAHNCKIGRGCVICGHSALSGSVTLGDMVRLAGRVAIADNLTVGDGASVGASSGVMNDIPAGETWIGSPAIIATESTRNYAASRRLWQIARDVKHLMRRERDAEHASDDPK